MRCAENEAEIGRLDRQGGEGVTDIAHDLKSPLVSIGCMARLLKKEAAKRRWDDPAWLVLLDQIDETSRYAISLVRTMCATSPPARLPYRDETVSVCDDFESHLRRLRDRREPVARFRGVTLAYRFSGFAPRMLIKPESVVDRALGNLVDNAIDFTPCGGTVSIHAEGRPEGVTIRISDTGPGFPPDVRPLVFTHRLASTRSGDAQAHFGYGLFIARRLVEFAGGRIELEESASGASFLIELPSLFASVLGGDPLTPTAATA
jgi:signal transduction histidine kinase